MPECLVLSLLAILIHSEAPYEPFEGKVAVAYVVMNRAEMVGRPVDEVIRQPRQFHLDPRARVTEADWRAAKAAYFHTHSDPTHGADHFYNPAITPWPPWYDERYLTARIGRHAFLKLGGV